MKKKWPVIASELFFLLVTVMVWIPIYYFVIGSFKAREDIVMFPLSIQSDMFSFGNYVYVWENMKIGNAILNTGIITVGALLLTVVISSLAGYALARIKGRFFNISYQYVVTLMVVPFISCLLMLVRLSTRLSLYNTIWGCILIHTAWHVPFCTFLYTGFMKSIPVELEEAAYIDGCSTFKTYKGGIPSAAGAGHGHLLHSLRHYHLERLPCQQGPSQQRAHPDADGQYQFVFRGIRQRIWLCFCRHCDCFAAHYADFCLSAKVLY